MYPQEEGEVASDQSLKEFEGATLRYASINLKYVRFKLSDAYLVKCCLLFSFCCFSSRYLSRSITAVIIAPSQRKKRSSLHSAQI